MRCNPFPLLGVYINEGTRVYDLDLLPNELIRHRVIVLCASHIDEAVLIDQQLASVLDFEAFSPERLQGRLVNGYEALLAGERQALHPTLVMEYHLLRNGRIKFINREELTVAERGVYVLVCKFDVVFNQSLVLRLA